MMMMVLVLHHIVDIIKPSAICSVCFCLFYFYFFYFFLDFFLNLILISFIFRVVVISVRLLIDSFDIFSVASSFRTPSLPPLF